MPGRHWIIAYNQLTGEYRMFLWYHELYHTREFIKLSEEQQENWMGFKYMGEEDRRPDWNQVGIYESEEEAMKAYTILLQK